MDWTATILAAAQTTPDRNYPLDGIDLLPAIRNAQQPSANLRLPSPGSARTFFWRNGNQDAAVKDPWKYLNDGTREYLFNLAIDEHEQADFRDEQPEVFNQLRTEFKAWEAKVLPRKK
jgi:arylsulfatase A-like enzyme